MSEVIPITTATKWERIDLALDEYNRPTEPPAICGLIYTGKRHAISGPPESAKTLVALVIGIEHIRQGGTFALIDFEMGAHATRLLLNELGATIEEISDHVHYIEASGGPELGDIQAIQDADVTLVIIDAAIGAYAVSGLDDMKREDAETFGRWWVRPLFDRGITTIVLDHVVKNTETRGKWTIGSERKLGQVDVHLGCEAIKQVHRGHTGLVKITTHKDRPAHLPRPTAANLELRSDPSSHAITWEFKVAASVDEEHPFRPTALMEKVSRYLEDQREPVSRNTIESDVKGKAEFLRKAIDALRDEGFTGEAEGPKQGRYPTRIYVSKRAYREALDPHVQQFVPGSSQFVPDATSEGSSLRPPPYGGTDVPGTNQNGSVTSRAGNAQGDLPDAGTGDDDIPW